MIDLTPLDVKKKKGEFRRVMRGYDPIAVDSFLDEVVLRMEELVRESGSLNARVQSMTDAMAEYRERERAMNEALVSAQQLREGMREQAAREAEASAARLRREVREVFVVRVR